MSDTADLLEEIAALKVILIAADARDRRKDERIAHLEKLVAAFRQAAFGRRRSEKSDPDQFERECPKVCVSDRAHAVFRYGQASKRPTNIMAS